MSFPALALKSWLESGHGTLEVVPNFQKLLYITKAPYCLQTFVFSMSQAGISSMYSHLCLATDLFRSGILKQEKGVSHFCLKKTFGRVWRHFQLSQGGNVLWNLTGRAEGFYSVQENPNDKDLSGHHVNNVDFEKP